MTKFTRKIIIFTVLTIGLSPIYASAQFTPDIYFEDAVPAVLDELESAGEQISDTAPIEAWAQDTEAGLPELLDELAASLMTYSDQPLENNSLDGLMLLSQKWNSIVNAYPDLAGVAVLVEPIIGQVIEALPELKGHQPGDTPFQNFYELYRTLEIQNPWGLSAFFQLEPLAPTKRVLSFLENIRRQTIDGVEDTFVFKRETTVTVNDEVVFHELIIDNEVVQHYKKTVDVTLVHEILNKIEQDGLDPSLVAAIQSLVDLIDFHLAEAQNSGLVVPDQSLPYMESPPATTQFMLDLFSSPHVQNVTEHIKSAMPAVASERAASAPSRRAYQETVQTVPISETQLASPKQKKSSVQAEPYKTVVLDQYDKSTNNISSIWLSVIFFPIFIVMFFQFIKYALSPTAALLRRRPDIYIR